METKIQVNYTSRDYVSIRQDLINYLRTFFPDQWQDFNVASPGMALVELNAYVGDLLSYLADKKFNELFLDGLTERVSAYRLAKTLGYKVPGVRPAISIMDLSIEVPVTADGPDLNYTPILRPGLQLRGGGQVFETLNEIDFSSDYSEDGVANRTIQPILNGNQDIIKYVIVKREVIKAGASKVLKREVLTADAQPFYQLTIPEPNVLEVSDVIVYEGQLGVTKTPTYEDFNNALLKYYEVDYLPTNKVFVVDSNSQENPGLYVGKYIEVEKRFEKEFMPNGSCMLTFGGGEQGYNAYESFITNLTGEKCQGTDLNISKILNNTALGSTIPPNSTIFVRYRVGGGTLSNVGTNVLTDVSNVDAQFIGTNSNTKQQVVGSLRASNPIPAIGGTGLPTINELRKYMAANYAAQNRCVTVQDYTSRCYQMPGKFGAPFRVFTTVEDNKVKIYILSREASGRLNASSTSDIKLNLLRYLTPYRMINDFVEINDAKIVNVQIECDLYVDKSFNVSEVKTNAIQVIRNFMDIEKWEMNENIYISQIVDKLRDVPGVINVVDLRFFNMESGGYSDTIHFQATGNRNILSTGGYRTQILYIDNSILGTPLSMFEIKYPDKDILVRVA